MTAATPSRTHPRDRYLDVLRAVALVRVVAYHTFGFGWFSIVFPSMGVMFALAGSLMAGSLDRMSSAEVVRNRIRRLLPSLWVLGLVLVPVMLWHGWPTDRGTRPLRWHELVLWVVPILDPPGSDWATDGVTVLWYIRAYLWFVLASPLLLPLFRRWPLATIVAPLVVVSAYAIGALDLNDLGLTGTVILDFGVYGACWVLGFAHHDGALRRLPLVGAASLAAGVMLLGGAWTLLHPVEGGGYDLNEIPMGQALWSVGAVLILLRFSPRMRWLESTPVLGRLVTVVNARALTIYLWHNLAIDLATPINDRLRLYSPLEQFATTWLLVGVAVLALGWVEDIAARRPPRLLPGGRPRPRPASQEATVPVPSGDAGR